MADIKSESIALAALFQCCSQINRIANTGYCDDLALCTVFRSLLVTDPDTVEDIYKLDSLKIGFKSLVDGFSSQSVTDSSSMQLTKLAMQIMSISDRIMGNSALYGRLSTEIDDLKKEIETEFPNFLDGNQNEVNDAENIKKFATLYQSLISPNFSKLLIFGEERFLSSTENQNKIRALLLAGIRAYVLFKQVGGKKIFLVLKRKDIIEYASKHI